MIIQKRLKFFQEDSKMETTSEGAIPDPKYYFYMERH